jgi:hypothetical protein
MKTLNAEVIFWNNKVFVPSVVRYRSGMSSGAEPVYVVGPSLLELVLVVQKVISTDPPIRPDPNKEEIKKQRQFLPTKMGAGSLRQLYKEAFYYLMELSDKGFLLCIPEVDLKHGWIFTNNNLFYPLGTDLQIIVQAMLDDYSNRRTKL